LVGTLRILTDGIFGTIPEMMVHPGFQKHGIGKGLLELAKQVSPTGLYFGAQPNVEGFYEKCGCKRGLQSFVLTPNQKT